MGQLVRLRVEMADVPGALAQAAAIIADHGGNITALDVQHSDDASAVDEVTIELRDASDLPKLRRRLDESGVAHVVALQSANPEDLLVRVLRRVGCLLNAPEQDGDGDIELRRGVADLCATPAVWVSTSAEAAAYAAGRQALSAPGDVVLMQTEERLPRLAETVSGAAWILAIAEPAAASRERVVFVARPLTKPFTTTEISRVGALIALYDQILALRELSSNGATATSIPDLSAQGVAATSVAGDPSLTGR
jgi:hypothetical protein